MHYRILDFMWIGIVRNSEILFIRILIHCEIGFVDNLFNENFDHFDKTI